jgi:outer membrane protein assembly factor BamB
MQILCRAAALAVVFTLLLPGSDWPSQSGGPQRDSWARAERVITRENVGSLELLYKYQTDNQAKGRRSLSTPIIAGMLITYRGFKEMLVFAGSGDNVYSVDADLNRLLWKRHFDTKGKSAGKSTDACPGGLTTSVVMPGSSSAGFRPPPKAAEQPSKMPAKSQAKKEAEEKLGSGFGRLGGMFTVSSDGFLHALNSSTGEDLLPSVQFVPPHSNVSSLNVMNNIIYAATTNRCGGKPNSLYAFDFASDEKKVATFDVQGGEIYGVGGTAIGTDGTVYVYVTEGASGKASKYGDSLVALSPQLEVKDYVHLPSLGGPQTGPKGAGITPAVVGWKDKELIVAGGSDGCVYLLDSTSLGGSDHQTPLVRSECVATATRGLTGAFSSWYDADSQTRWIYAPVGGVTGAKSGSTASGAVIAFQLSDANGHPALKKAWESQPIVAPSAPATANGIVFTLSEGNATTPATLHLLDGTSGKELSSGSNVASTYSDSGGVAVANGRVYFTTHDNAVYCLGFSKMNPQLTDH